MKTGKIAVTIEDVKLTLVVGKEKNSDSKDNEKTSQRQKQDS